MAADRPACFKRSYGSVAALAAGSRVPGSTAAFRRPCQCRCRQRRAVGARCSPRHPRVLVVLTAPTNRVTDRIRARREQRPVDRPESEEGIGSEQAAPAASVGVRPLDDSTPTSTATELYVFMKQAPYTRLRHGPCGSRDLF